MEFVTELKHVQHVQQTVVAEIPLTTLVIATGLMVPTVNLVARYVIHAFQVAKQHVLQAASMLATVILEELVLAPLTTPVGKPQ